MPTLTAPPSIEGLSAVVTGGSRGLGLLMARDLAERGCSVTITARDAGELEEAVEMLERSGRDSVRSAVCDVRDRASMRELFDDTAAREGSVDIVIGNAGIIQVAPVQAMDEADFHDAMDSIFTGALHTSLEALPHLRLSPAGGRLALIGSIGGLLAAPHLLPYSCAKAAVAALAEGLHEEESHHGVTVTAVHPGLMRTGSHLHARFGGDAEREFAWFSTVAGLPLLSMDAERAADRIITAVQRRRTRIVLTPAARLGAKFHGLAPVTTTRIASAAARVLPHADGEPAEMVEGATVEGTERTRASRLRTLCSTLNDRAADRFNQRGRTITS